ncbi:hypothetical protein ABZ341_17990 [Streptomyces sp. NPDC006173]|uniref:DUF6197 family protein n=1 Tax=Streptomyces sp. NPDC006173 TaxID=3155349 RepID=UPI0033CCC137
MKLAEIYLKAAEVIRTNGHYKGAYFEPSPESGVGITPSPSECAVCIAGALSIAISGDPIPDRDFGPNRRQYDAIAGRLADLMNIEGDPKLEPVGRLAGWNDAEERTADDVVAAFQQAAKAVA